MDRLGSTEAAQWDPGRRYSVVRDGAGLPALAADLQHHRRREKREEQPGSASMSPERCRGFSRACHFHGLGRPHSSTWTPDGGRGAQVSASSILRQTVPREFLPLVPIDGFKPPSYSSRTKIATTSFSLSLEIVKSSRGSVSYFT